MHVGDTVSGPHKTDRRTAEWFVSKTAAGKPRYETHYFSGHLEPGLKGFRWKLAKMLFMRAELDEEGQALIAEYAAKGAVVFASHESSNFALLMFNATLHRAKLPTLDFALEYNPVILQTPRHVWRRMVHWVKRNIFRISYPDVYDTDHIEKIIRGRGHVLFSMLSGKFFMRRYVESRYDSILYLLKLQQQLDFPIFIMPEIIFWNRIPERTARFVPTPPATGNRMILVNLLSSATPSYIKLMKPVNLQEILAAAGEKDLRAVALELRNSILEMYQKQKRIVLGPVLRSRNEIAEKVLYHKNVMDTIDELSREQKIPSRRLKNRAYRYFDEIAADFSIVFIRSLEGIFDLVFRKVFSGIVCDPESVSRLREAAERGPLVLTPCHKSHMDYLILSYICYKYKVTPPHIAAGVNLSFFPLGTIFRRSGAFFLRRSFKGLKLYTVVFKQYLKTLVEDSYLLEFFVEGGRTRTGRLVFPKMGIINYLIEAIDEGYNKDLIFLPISINYDRVPEEKSYMKELKGKEKRGESVTSVIKSGSVLQKDHGKVYVSIGEAITLKEVESAGFTGDERVQEIGLRIINGIYQVTSVTPVALTAAPMLMMALKGFTRKGLMRNMMLVHEYFSYCGAFFSETTRDKYSVIDIGDHVLRMFMREKFIEQLRYDEKESDEDFFVIKEEARPPLSFYKNSITHFMLDISLLCCAVMHLRHSGMDIEIPALGSRMHYLKNLASREYVFGPRYADMGALAERIIREFMIPHNILKERDGRFIVSEENFQDIIMFSRALQDVVESYFIVFDYAGRMDEHQHGVRDLTAEIRKYGLKLYHTEVIRAPESLSIPNYTNALKKLAEYGILSEDHGGKKGVLYRMEDRVRLKELRDGVFSYVSSLK